VIFMTDGRLAGGSGRHERACCWRRRHDQRRTGELNPPEGGWSIHNTEVLADRAYSSWYSHGIVALDVSHPTRPAKVGQFVPPPPAGGEPPFALVWGVAIDPGTGIIYASDINSGLWIVRPTGHARPSPGG
jgi:hypothetical protein